jgi:uncharacterized membrane protein
MTDIVLARALHVLAVVLWIGGVGMVITWAIFTVMLFVAEPLFLDRILARRAAAAPEATYRVVEWLHRGLLVLSLVTVAGAVAGSLGVNLFAW